MKKVLIAFLIAIFAGSGARTQTKTPAMDQSPMDMSYYPPNYPILKIQDKITEPLVARVVYSRPQRNGRTVFSDLVEYDKVWRLGANEATEIEFFKNVSFAGKPIAKGRYTMYALPNTDKWIIIINKETDTWGSFKYDAKKDLARIEVPVQKVNDPVEDFSIYFDKTPAGFDMTAAWENLTVSIPITVYEKQPLKATNKILKGKS